MPLGLFLAGSALFLSYGFFPALSALAASVLLLMLYRRGKTILAVFLIAGFLYPLVRESLRPEIPDNSLLNVRAVFTSSASDARWGFQQEMKILEARFADSGAKAKGVAREMRLYSKERFKQGGIYGLVIKHRSPEPKLVPGITRNSYASLVNATGYEGESAVESWRAGVNAAIANSVGGDSGAFIIALTTGERKTMSAELKEVFNRTGLAHLLSISGAHFGLFSITLFYLIRFVLFRLSYPSLERLTTRASIDQISALLCLPLLVFYLLISGGSIPAMRSFIMICLFMAGLLTDRKGAWLTFLLFAAAIIVLWEPSAMSEPSFVLSFTAVLFIGFIAGRRKYEKRRPIDYPLDMLWITIAAMLGVGPLTAYYFNHISTVTPVANLIVGPIVGFLLVPLSIASALVYILSGYFPLASALGYISSFSIYIASALSALKFSDIAVPAFPAVILAAYYAAFGIYLLNKKALVFVAPALLAAIYSGMFLFSGTSLSVTFLDTGASDSAVIETPDKKAYVVDTGRSGFEAFIYLRRQAITEIGGLILTHPHADHTGGAVFLSESFRIDALYHNGYPPEDAFKTGAPMKRLAKGDEIKGGGWIIRVLHPPAEPPPLGKAGYERENNLSLVLKIEGKGSYLLTSDIHFEAEELLLKSGASIDADILKAPHHGSKTSADAAFIDAVSPSVSVITSPSVTDKMRAALTGSDVFLTGKDGSLKIIDSPDGFTIRKYSDYMLRRAKSPKDELRNIRNLFRVW